MASLSGKDSLSIGELADIVLAKQPTVTKLVVDGAAERRRRRQIVQQTLTKHVGHEDL